MCRGTFTVYVDGEDYDDGYVAFPEGYSGYYDFTLSSYGSCGNHNYEIEYVTSDETHASFSVSGSFEVTNYKITGGEIPLFSVVSFPIPSLSVRRVLYGFISMRSALES